MENQVKELCLLKIIKRGVFIITYSRLKQNLNGKMNKCWQVLNIKAKEK